MSYQSDLLYGLINRLSNDLPATLSRMELLQTSNQSLKKALEDNTKQQLLTTIFNICEFHEHHRDLNIMSTSEEKEILQLIKTEAISMYKAKQKIK